MGWINENLPAWVSTMDHVEETQNIIRQRLGWNK